MLPSLVACNYNREATLIGIRDISYNQRNSISRTSPQQTKWSFANPLQLLIAAANITGHKWLHPHTQIWLIKHGLGLSALFTPVYDFGINAYGNAGPLRQCTLKWFMLERLTGNVADSTYQPTNHCCFLKPSPPPRTPTPPPVFVAKTADIFYVHSHMLPPASEQRSCGFYSTMIPPWQINSKV